MPRIVTLAVFAAVVTLAAGTRCAAPTQPKPSPGDGAAWGIRGLPPELSSLVLDFVALKSDVLVSAGGRAASLWASDGTVRTLRRRRGNILGLAFFPLGDRAVTWSTDGAAVIWNTTTGGEILELTHDASVLNAKVFAGGDLVLTLDGTGMATVWRAADATRVATFRLPEVSDADAVPGGRNVVAAGWDYSFIWHSSGGTRCDLATSLQGMWVAMFPDGERVFVVGAEHERMWTGSIWNAGNCALIHRLGEAWWPAAISTSGDLVAAAVVQGIAIWNTHSGCLLRIVPRSVHAGDEDDDTLAIGFLPQTDLVVAMTSQVAATFDPRTGEEVMSSRSRRGWFQRLAVSPAGDVFATCGPQQTVLWDARSGAPLRSWNVSRRGHVEYCRVAVGVGRALGPREFGSGASARLALTA